MRRWMLVALLLLSSLPIAAQVQPVLELRHLVWEASEAAHRGDRDAARSYARQACARWLQLPPEVRSWIEREQPGTHRSLVDLEREVELFSNAVAYSDTPAGMGLPSGTRERHYLGEADVFGNSGLGRRP